jgi:hypothetical protein
LEKSCSIVGKTFCALEMQIYHGHRDKKVESYHADQSSIVQDSAGSWSLEASADDGGGAEGGGGDNIDGSTNGPRDGAVAGRGKILNPEVGMASALIQPTSREEVSG